MANVEILRGKLRCLSLRVMVKDILIQDPAKMVRGKLTNRKSENSQFKTIRSYLVMGDKKTSLAFDWIGICYREL